MPIYKTDDKKDGLIKYRVVVYYKDLDGNHTQKERHVYGKEEAKREESRLMAEMLGGSAIKTVRDLYDEYMYSIQKEIRQSTYDKKRRILEGNILPTMAKVKIKDLDARTLQRWKNVISNADTAFRTKNNYYKEFVAMLNYAVKLNYLQKNPLSALGGFRDPEEVPTEGKLQYYTADQFKAYISVAKQEAESRNNYIGYAVYVFFCIAYYTGMRKGEINALKWSDIEKDTIHVRRSITQKIKGKEEVETPPKNKSSYRDVQMPQPLIAILSEHKARQRAFFGSTRGRVCGGSQTIRDSTLENYNKKFSELAGLPHIRIHDFRHSHASLLANEGINISEIARRLGHSDIKMTLNTYSHLYPREEERALSVLNKIFLE